MINKGRIWRALAGSSAALEELGQKPDMASAYMREQLRQLRERSAIYMQTPLPALSYGDFCLYWQTGERARYQAAYFERRQRLLCFSLLCWLEKTPSRYLPYLEETLWQICAEAFWCVPAHFLDEAEQALPPGQFATHLDLFACETGFALSEVLAVNREQLDPRLEQEIRLQIDRRIFAPFLDSSRLFRFEHMRNNWSAVCGSAVGGAALRLLEGGPSLAAVLHRALSCIDVYLDSFGEDGVCVEGVDYWTYGFGFFTSFADLLLRRTKGALDLFEHEKVRAIAKSQQIFYLAGDTTISFSDGSETGRFRVGIGCYLQRRYPEVELPELRYALRVLDDSCGRYCLSLRDLLWYDAAASYGIAPQKALWMPDAQWFISCRGSLVVAAKAGNNAESHNHNDCGSFILLRDGVPLVCDLGAGLYDAQYFSERRYEVFVNASRSHNVAIIDGVQQAAGAEYAAWDAGAEFGGGEDRFWVRLEKCYPCANLKKYQRVIRNLYVQDMVLLCDRVSFHRPGRVCEVFVSRHPIELEAGSARFLCGKAGVRMRFDPQVFRARLQAEPYLDHQGAGRTAHLVCIENRDFVTEIVCEISMETLI